VADGRSSPAVAPPPPLPPWPVDAAGVVNVNSGDATEPFEAT
jgi:hypothetical protein